MSRHVNYQFNLSEEQENWVLDARSRCTKILEKQFPDGRHFLKTFQHVAAHERKWIRWKLESCPNVEKSAIDVSEGVVKKKLEVIVIVVISGLNGFSEKLAWK
jgi:THO complex subunit 1